MIIKLANKDDCSEVAKLHVQEIKWGFLSELGERFLYYFYLATIDSQKAFLIVAENNGSIVGFVSGCIDLKKFYKDFAKKYTFRVLPLLFKKFFSINSLKKIFETRKYTKQEEKNLPKTELLSITVSSKFQGSGIAQKLLENFISEIKKRNIDQFKVIVGENLIRAIRFYEKSGFEFYSQSFIHQDMPSRIYIYNIKKQ